MTMLATSHGTTYVFGTYRLEVSRQALTRNGTRIRLGSRAVAILATLIEARGEVVGKQELIRAVWPDTFVEESNLRVHMVAIRKALEDTADTPRYVANVAGRGYRFVGDAETLLPREVPAALAPPVETAEPARLPVGPARIFGREQEAESLAALLAGSRLVTVVGPGGVGKTTLAVTVAARLEGLAEEGAAFVDLSAITEPSQVPLAVAAALKVSPHTDTPLVSLAALLRHRSILVVLDNCEHVIDAAAQLAEALLRTCPSIRILASSHEPLRLAAEKVLRLNPLAIPERRDLALSEARRYPAVALLIDRVTAAQPALVLTDAHVPAIVEICSRLDGLPLAIEIAAATADIFSIDELAERLDQRLRLFAGNRRTAAARHQTMRSLLDWSFEQLSPRDGEVLRRLSIYPGSFDLDGAIGVAATAAHDGLAVTEALGNLVRKSLLLPHPVGGRQVYRMLDSTRLYASELLARAGEVEMVRRAHASQLLVALESADAEWVTTPRALWLDRHRGLIDDIRAALGWALNQRNDLRLAIRLASLAMPVGLQLGLVDEFRAIAEAAVEAAPSLDPPELVAEMRLLITNGFLSQNVRGPKGEHLPYLDRAIALAEQTGSDQHRIEPRLFFASFNLALGDYATAIAHAERAHELAEASGEDLALLGAKRMLAQVATFAGRHQQARLIARSVLAHPVVHIPYAYGNMQTDKRVSMRFVMARSLWIEGYPDQARDIVEEAVTIAPEDGPQALSHALALGACPVLLWRGDDDRAGELTDRLLTHAARFGMAHWRSWGELFGDVLSQRRGEWPTGEPIAAAGGLQQASLATFNGQVEPHTRVVPADWSAPELQRLLGEAQLRLGNRAAGETMLNDAMELARSHGAMAWELRVATSLMRLHAETKQAAAARDRLAGVLDRFTEGRDTADLRTAVAWLRA